MPGEINILYKYTESTPTHQMQSSRVAGVDLGDHPYSCPTQKTTNRVQLTPQGSMDSPVFFLVAWWPSCFLCLSLRTLHGVLQGRSLVRLALPQYFPDTVHLDCRRSFFSFPILFTFTVSPTRITTVFIFSCSFFSTFPSLDSQQLTRSQPYVA